MGDAASPWAGISTTPKERLEGRSRESSRSKMGTASDPEDGDLSADVVWTSSKDGRIGTGASIAVTGLSRGRHTIEAEVTDAAGQSGSDTIRLRVSR